MKYLKKEAVSNVTGEEMRIPSGPQTIQLLPVALRHTRVCTHSQAYVYAQFFQQKDRKRLPEKRLFIS